MKLLITGAGGQLGKEWVEYCLQNDINHTSFGSEELDISDFNQAKEVLDTIKPDVLINCAAYTHVDDAEENKLLSFKVNSTAVKNLSWLCKSNNIKLVHYSTDYVFSGELNDKIKFPSGYPEEAVPKPVNQYGLSKWQGEKELQESECDYLLIRIAWLCGKHGNNFVKTMLRLGSQRDSLNIVDDQFGSPTFCSDVVEKTFKLLQNNKKGIYHISSSDIITWYEFASEIFNISNIDIALNAVTSEEFITKAKRPSFSKLSTQKISTISGIEILDWKLGLEKLIQQL